MIARNAIAIIFTLSLKEQSALPDGRVNFSGGIELRD
jgi:hypothetical protein